MFKPGTLLILITALVWTSSASPETILKSLKQNFLWANGRGSQYAVLYLHKGDVAQPLPDYDVQGLCLGGNLQQQIADWTKRVGPEGMVATLKPPIWPTNALSQLKCKDHPNIAVAGVDKGMPTNKGHSEYFLLKNPDALHAMLTSYKKNDKHSACPEAFFLYTYLSPCHSCANVILSAKQVINDACKKNKFYLGYTKVYGKDWTADEQMLKKYGVDVSNVP
jgi:deoxycytidylate deaminase